MTALAVVVVAYRDAASLERALATARSSVAHAADLIVVDNAPDEPGSRQVSDAAGATYLASPSNVGFCAAVNRGLATTDADYVLLLNPDARVSADYVERLVAHLDRDPSLASAGGRILRDGAERPSIDSVGIAMERGRRPVDIGHGSPDDGVRDGVDEVFGVTAAAAVYRRSALLAVAVDGAILPEEYFMYLDDVDLAWRLRLAGFGSIVDHSAIAWHGRHLAGDTNGTATGIARIRQTMARESERPDYVRERSWVNMILTLVRNDDPEAFLAQAPYMIARRLPGDLFGVVQRPAMALSARWRLGGLLPGALEARREIQSRRVVSAREMARWLP